MNRLKTQIVLVILAAVLLGILIVGCAADAEFSFTAFDGSVEKGSQTSLSVGRAARD